MYISLPSVQLLEQQLVRTLAAALRLTKGGVHMPYKH